MLAFVLPEPNVMHNAHSVRPARYLMLALLAAFAGDLCAQVTSGPQHRPGRRSICRYDDTLYAVAFVDTGELTLWAQPEGSGTWTQVVIAGGINDSNSGITNSVPTNYAAMTATNDGVLHIAWGRGSYPTFYEFYYRAIDPVAATTVTNVLNTTAFVGTSNLNRSDAIEIAAVDDAGAGQPAVYLTAQGWNEGTTLPPRMLMHVSGTLSPGQEEEAGVAEATLREVLTAVSPGSQRVDLRRVDAEGDQFNATIVLDLANSDEVGAMVSRVQRALPGGAVSIVEGSGLD